MEEKREKKHQNDSFSFYYGLLSHQQNMLEDSIRTSTYQNAMLRNCKDFKDKVVLDVGTGSGILALFAIQAGARKVYAVEASDMAKHAEKIIKLNGLSDKITVIKGKVEQIDLPEKVDIIVSEPMGVLLVHERMLESFVLARDKHLKPEGAMFPSTGTIFISPFTDAALYLEQISKAQFWTNNNFYGVDFSGMFNEAMLEHIGQPVVGPVDPSTLLAPITACATHRLDFNKDPVELLRNFTIPFSFTINRNDTLHGLACWFDVSFICPHSTTRVTLSTSPTAPITHWYQCRLVFQTPLNVRRGNVLMGSCLFVANDNSSFDITVKAQLKGVGSEFVNKFFLHNVLFRCYWASTSPTTTTTSIPSMYDMNGYSTMSTASTSYLPPTTYSGTPQWTPTPGPQTWLGPSESLSPRRKMARLSTPSTNNNNHTNHNNSETSMQVSYNTDYSSFDPARSSFVSTPSPMTYPQNNLGYGYTPNGTNGYTNTPPRYYYGYGTTGNGS